jgi:WD40 repeat protein
VFDLLWYNNETQLVTVGADMLCQLFQIETQQVLQTAQDHQGSIKCVGKTEDGSMIATGGRDGKVFFYDTR